MGNMSGQNLRKRKMIKIMTAFSGGFGSVEFAMKYENIEHEVVAACEWLDPQRKSYLLNHGEPTANFYKDIRDLDGTKYKGDITLLHLSPPCTSFSLAGKREGINCETGNLMYDAVRLIGEVEPEFFIIENVPPLLTIDNSETIKDILRQLSKFGYRITMDLLNARDMGTPQNRLRLFIVGEKIL